MAFTGEEFILPALVYLKPGSTIDQLIRRYKRITGDKSSKEKIAVCHFNIDFQENPYEITSEFHFHSRKYYRLKYEGSKLPEKYPEKGVFSYGTSSVAFEQKVPWRTIDNQFYLDEEALLDCDEDFCYYENLREQLITPRLIPSSNFGETAFNSVTFTAELIRRRMTKYLKTYISYEDMYLLVPKLCTMFPKLIPSKVRHMMDFWDAKYARKNNLSNSELMRQRMLRTRKPSEIIQEELKAIEHDFGKRLKNFDPYTPKKTITLKERMERWETPFG